VPDAQWLAQARARQLHSAGVCGSDAHVTRNDLEDGVVRARRDALTAFTQWANNDWGALHVARHEITCRLCVAVAVEAEKHFLAHNEARLYLHGSSLPVLGNGICVSENRNALFFLKSNQFFFF
jgi:hypothetical protein